MIEKVYYLVHCGSGRTTFFDKLELVKETNEGYVFKIFDYDWDKQETRDIRLKAKKSKRLNFKNEYVDTIEFRSSKEQYKYHFIRCFELDTDKVKIENHFISDNGEYPDIDIEGKTRKYLMSIEAKTGKRDYSCVKLLTIEQIEQVIKYIKNIDDKGEI